MLFGHMSIITPATVISIQYKLLYAKYKNLCVTDSSIVSLLVEWPFVAYNPPIKHFLTFSHIPCKSVTTSAVYHGRYIGHCVYIFSTHMDMMWLFSLLIAVYINLVDPNDYTKQRVLMHMHQGWNVRHGLCHIYMRYVYIHELFIALVCFAVCSLL